MHNAGNHVYAYNAASGTVTEVASGTLKPSNWSSGNGAYNAVTVYGFEDGEGVAQTAVVDAYMHNTGFTDKDVITAISRAACTAAVPEPATATLSLLALAGIAARRPRPRAWRMEKARPPREQGEPRLKSLTLKP